MQGRSSGHAGGTDGVELDESESSETRRLSEGSRVRKGGGRMLGWPCQATKREGPGGTDGIELDEPKQPER